MKIFVLDYKEVIENLLVPMDLNRIQEYLNGGRQDVLYNIDVFCDNVRSKNLKETNFDIFERVTSLDEDSVVVFPIYLELFEFLGIQQNIKYVIEFYTAQFPNNQVVFFWNHDQDFAKYNGCLSGNENWRIINYNTSKKTDRDIVVPFWTMQDITPIKEDKQIFCSFIGGVSHPLRRSIILNINKKSDDFVHLNGLGYEDYRKKLSQSLFSLCPRGAGLSSYRFFECIHTNTIPVLIADDVELPYQEELDYDFIVRYPQSKSHHLDDFNNLENILKNIDTDTYLNRIEEIRHKFTLKGVQEYIHRRLSI